MVIGGEGEEFGSQELYHVLFVLVVGLLLLFDLFDVFLPRNRHLFARRFQINKRLLASLVLLELSGLLSASLLESLEIIRLRLEFSVGLQESLVCFELGPRLNRFPLAHLNQFDHLALEFLHGRGLVLHVVELNLDLCDQSL